MDKNAKKLLLISAVAVTAVVIINSYNKKRKVGSSDIPKPPLQEINDDDYQMQMEYDLDMPRLM